MGRSRRVGFGWRRQGRRGGGGSRGCPLSSLGSGGLHLCGSPPRGSAPLTSLFLSVSVCLLISHTPALSFPRTSQARKSGPEVQERGRPRPRGEPRALFPSFFSSAERREPPRQPARRADGASEDPSGQISLPFDRSFPIRSGFPPPRDGASAPARLPGLPQGVRVRPAPPGTSGGDFCGVPGLEPPGLWAGRFGEGSGRRSQAAPGSPPLLPPIPPPAAVPPVLSARSTYLPKTSVLCSVPQPSPAQSGTGGKLVPKQHSLSFEFFTFRISHPQKS